MKYKILKGSVAVEASLSLTFFIFGYMALISLISIIRTESTIQYSIDRTAAELAQYCYAAEKLSLLSEIEKSDMTIGDAVVNIGGLTDISGGDLISGEETAEIIGKIVDYFTGDITIGGIAAGPICRALMPRYIADNRKMADDYLEKLAGINIDDIDFHLSSFLKDGKTIEIVAVYNVYLNIPGFSFVNNIEIEIKNTASAIAWISGREAEDTENEGDSKWNMGNLERGKAWVNEIKSEHPMDAVKGGYGIDLYHYGEYSAVSSLNIFASKYSKFSGDDQNNPDLYTLNSDVTEKSIIRLADKLKDNISKNSGKLQTEKGIHIPDFSGEKQGTLILVIPEEAKNSDFGKFSDIIAEHVKSETGIKIVYEYREKALGR